MKKLIAVFLMVTMLTGCESSGRVHDKNYLRAVEIDGDKITMCFFGENTKPVKVKAENPVSAVEKAELITGKQIFTGYTEMIAIKECDTVTTLENMLHHLKVSPSCYVVRTQVKDIFSENSAEVLEGSVKNALLDGFASDCDIITVMGNLLDPRIKTEIPEINSKGFIGNTVI